MRKFFLHICLFLTVFETCLSIEVKCVFNHITWENMNNAYTCSAVDFIVRTSNETVDEVTGTHETGKTNGDVKKLNIEQQVCLFIPRGFEKFFPKLEGLRIAKSRLIRLRQFDLSVHPKLRNCDMFNNWLDVITGDIFAKNLDLEYLYFGDNQIFAVGVDLMKPLKKLKKVVFQGNVCIRENAETKIMIEKLQEVMNKECGIISDYERTRGEFVLQSVAISKGLDKNDRVNDLDELAQLKRVEENPDPMLQENSLAIGLIAFWVCLCIAIVAAAIVVVYFRKYRVNSPIASDNIGILPTYSAMENGAYDDAS